MGKKDSGAKKIKNQADRLKGECHRGGSSPLVTTAGNDTIIEGSVRFVKAMYERRRIAERMSGKKRQPGEETAVPYPAVEVVNRGLHLHAARKGYG